MLANTLTGSPKKNDKSQMTNGKSFRLLLPLSLDENFSNISGAVFTSDAFRGFRDTTAASSV